MVRNLGNFDTKAFVIIWFAHKMKNISCLWPFNHCKYCHANTETMATNIILFTFTGSSLRIYPSILTKTGTNTNNVHEIVVSF